MIGPPDDSDRFEIGPVDGWDWVDVLVLPVYALLRVWDEIQFRLTGRVRPMSSN